MATSKSAATIIARGTSNAAFTQLTGCSVTRSGTTATLTKTSHGRSNGDTILVQGFELEEFNGIFVIGGVTSNTFTYTIKQDPGANPSGTTGTIDKVTLGTALDLSTAYGGYVVLGIQNGNSAPGVAAQIWMGVANGSAEADYRWSAVFSGDVVANSSTVRRMPLDIGIMYVNFAVCRNTTNPVDCFALASKVVSG